jgi:hypothetical protein
VSAIALTAGLAVAGCAPVKMGAAAIVGDQRITLANLDTNTGQLTAAAKSLPASFQPTAQQATQGTLSLMIRFQVAEQLAKNEGITVTSAQEQAAFDSFYNSLKQQAQSAGLTGENRNGLLAAAGIARGFAPSSGPSVYGEFVAIENQYLITANGGTAPSTQAEANAANAKFSQAFCRTAKSLDISVSPQFGRLDYTNYTVVSAPDTVSRPSGPVTTTSLEGLAPAC